VSAACTLVVSSRYIPTPPLWLRHTPSYSLPPPHSHPPPCAVRKVTANSYLEALLENCQDFLTQTTRRLRCIFALESKRGSQTIDGAASGHGNWLSRDDAMKGRPEGKGVLAVIWRISGQFAAQPWADASLSFVLPETKLRHLRKH